MLRRRRALERFRRETVAVHLTTGRTFVGAVAGDYADALHLTAARALDGRVEEFVGDVVIPRERIDFAQVRLPAEAVAYRADA